MRFVIIAAPRTGSSHLVNLITAHPEVWCHGNVFKRQVKRLPIFLPNGTLSGKRDEELLSLRMEDEEAFLEEVFCISGDRPNVGFKIFEDQSDNILRKLIGDSKVRKVVLFRDNILANYSSTLAALETGQWSARKDNVVEPALIKFRRRDFIKFHNNFVSFYKKIIDLLTEFQQVVHWIDYTAVNDSASLSALFTFIGADGSVKINEADQVRKQVKQNPSNILSRFENCQRVQLFLEECNLMHWNYEGERHLDPIILRNKSDER